MIRIGLAALLLAGCAESRAPEIQNAALAERLPARPSIVSLNPCSDAVLAEVADPAQLLAISHYSHDPRASSMDVAHARRFAVTGGTAEEVLALDPDVVVAIPKETTAIPMSSSAARIAAAAVPVEGERVATVLWQSGGIVAGEAALVTDLLSRAGFTSHSAARGLGQADYLSLEQVAADPPELLLVAGKEPGQNHPLLDHLTQSRVEPFDPGLVYCGGPTIIRAMERLRTLRTAMHDPRLASAAPPQ